jgi:hypothetical protein
MTPMRRLSRFAGKPLPSNGYQTVAASRQSCSFPGGFLDYRAAARAARSWDRHPLPGSTCSACARGDQDAGPTLRDRMTPHRPQHRVPPLHPSLLCSNQWRTIARRQGFPSRSFSTTLSSITSATKRFSLVFSSSSGFSRLASDKSIPYYLAFSL